LIVGCAALERQAAVPSNLTEEATVLGIPNARFWPDTQGPALIQEANAALARERTVYDAAGANGPLPAANFLAVSGGSDNGAFAAGLLLGWTDSGTRPSFKLVTGISTGALVAPFAFLGPAYDQQLRAVYTGIGPKDVYEERGLLKAVFSESVVDTAPLFRLISRYANGDMLTAIAEQYRKGRLLLIGTTDLDVQRPVIWNIGAIAASGRPEALDLVRKILLASAAVPGVFPPVLIDGRRAGGITRKCMWMGARWRRPYWIHPRSASSSTCDRVPWRVSVTPTSFAVAGSTPSGRRWIDDFCRLRDGRLQR